MGDQYDGFDGIEKVKQKFLGPTSSSHLLYCESDSSKLFISFCGSFKCSRQITEQGDISLVYICQRCVEQTGKKSLFLIETLLTLFFF